MVDFVKKKIVEKLAKFTKHLNPSDISLSFLKGKGELKNLDLNADFITDALRLPPWIRIKSVFCDQIKIVVPFTDLHKSPIRCLLSTVIVEVSTCDDQDEDRERTDIDLKKLSSSTTSSYGLTEKIVDGMKVEIGLVKVHFANPVFNADLEMTDVIIESTTPTWKPDILPQCRYKNEDEGSVIIYKRCIWSSFKLEGCGIDDKGNKLLVSPVRLMASNSEIHATIKRRLSDCKVLYTRVSVDLGDLSWVVSQENLKSVSLLVQSLIEAAVKWNQKERKKIELLRGSRDSLDSVGSSSSIASSTKEEDSTRHIRKSKSSTKDLRRETSVRNRELRYQLGQVNLPMYEVIQDSIHIKSGCVNLQLCDGHGSLLLQVNDLLIDIYLDQMATTGRCHWNKSNVKLEEATEWSSKLVKTAEKIQYVDLPSINLYKLRERGIVVRCTDFSIRSENEELLPIISCDNKTFRLPNDLDNPAFQFVISMYHYPLEEGHKFLVPRPNIYAYLSPIHVNVHQQLFLWLAEFAHGVVRTINLNLLLSARMEGKMFIEEIKAKRETIQQLPGIDAKCYIPYTKITLPSECSYTDGRPRAIQIETAGINLENHTLLSVLSNPEFVSAWERCRSGWLSNTTDQFPNSNNDPPSTPSPLVDLIEKELKSQKAAEKQSSSDNRSNSVTHLKVPQTLYSRNSTGRHSAPDISHHKISLHQLNLLSIETWYCQTRCLSLSFVKDLSHEATLYGTEFVPDFPVQLWMFQPRKISELLSLGQSPTSESHLDKLNSLPVLHLLLDVPQEVQVKMERLHFLFLMRLKDSFQGFKTKLMQYLTLDSLLQAQETEAFHTTRSNVSLETDDTDDGEEIKEKLAAAFKDKSQNEPSSPSVDNISSLMTAAINVHGIKVIVSLPSLGPVLKLPKEGSPVLSQSNLNSLKLHNSISSGESPCQKTTSPSSLNVPSGSQTSQKTQSMPQLNTPVETKSVFQSPTSNESTDSFVYVSDPSVSPQSIPLTPEVHEAIEISPDNTGEIVSEISEITANSIDSPQSSVNVDSGELFSVESETDVPIELRETYPEKQPQPNEPDVKTNESLLVPTHSLYICTGKLKLLLTMSEEGISVRTTVDALHINELTNSEINELENRKTNSKLKSEDVACPVIKARVLLGKGVAKYFPDTAMTEFPIDGVLFLKVSGLKVVLGIKNLMAVKDFFDDENEAVSPLPIQLRIIETQLVIKDQLSLPLVHPKNATVNVPDIFINRGPRAHGTNLIQNDTVESFDADETDNPPVVQTMVNEVEPNSNVLLDTFQHFVDAFQGHNTKKGTKMVSNPEKVAQLLEELSKELSSLSPSYSDTLSCEFYSNVSSTHPRVTVDNLRAETEALRQDNKKLQLELVSDREEQATIIKERDDVTRELVEVKVKLANMNFVMEKQLIKMERLYSENCNLKDRLGE